MKKLPTHFFWTYFRIAYSLLATRCSPGINAHQCLTASQLYYSQLVSIFMLLGEQGHITCPELLVRKSVVSGIEPATLRSLGQSLNPTTIGPHFIVLFGSFSRRDLFGVGGFSNLPEYHLTYEDLMTELSKTSGKEHELTCEIMTSLRRRNMKLKDHQLIMGPYKAWADYLPSFKKKDGQCDPWSTMLISSVHRYVCLQYPYWLMLHLPHNHRTFENPQ